MSIEKLTSLISRVFFIIAFVLLGMAVIERVVNVFDYTILRRPAGRLLEFAAVFLVFVIALQLREVRDAIRSRRPQG